MVGLVRAGRHVVQALANDTQALPHFIDPHHAAVVSIAVVVNRHLEVEVLVARIRTGLAQVVVDAGGAQTGTGHTPFQRFFRVVLGHVHSAAAQDTVLQAGLFIIVQPLGQPVDKGTHQFFPTVGQVLRHTADTIPGRVHAEAGDGFDHVIGFLAIGEGEEDGGDRAHVHDEGTQEQQVAGDAEHFRQHHPDDLDPVGHFDAGQFFHRQHVRKVVHHAAQIIDAVGVGNIAVPGLALGHLLGATVVVADVGHAVDDLFTVQLQDDAEGAVGTGVVGAQVEEHVVLVAGAALHAPFFRIEAQGFLGFVLTGDIQNERIEFGGAGRVVLAQGVTLPVTRHQQAEQVGVALEVNAKQIKHFAFVPVGVGPDLAYGGDVQVAFGQGHLDAHVAVPFQRQ